MKSIFLKHPTFKASLGLLCLTLSSLNIAYAPTSFANDEAPIKKSRAILITTTQPNIENWSIEISTQGEIRPWQQAVISSKTNGISAVSINVLAGDSIKKGQVLAKFDSRILQAQLKQSEADLQFAQANLNLAKTNLTRYKKPQFRKTLSQQEFDNISNQMEIATANKAKMEAALSLAKIRLDDATVIAPENGTVLERNIELGQVSQTGDVLFNVLRQNKLEWVAEVDAKELSNIQLGMLATINAPNGKVLTGKVRVVSPLLSAQTRLGQVRILLDENMSTAVNSYATGTIITGNEQATVLPANAVVIKDGKTYVFVINNGKAQQLLVKLGRRYKNNIEILSNINVKDAIALEGAGFLNNGDVVSIKQTSTSSEAGTL